MRKSEEKTKSRNCLSIAKHCFLFFLLFITILSPAKGWNAEITAIDEETFDELNQIAHFLEPMMKINFNSMTSENQEKLKKLKSNLVEFLKSSYLKPSNTFAFSNTTKIKVSPLMLQILLEVSLRSYESLKHSSDKKQIHFALSCANSDSNEAIAESCKGSLEGVFKTHLASLLLFAHYFDSSTCDFVTSNVTLSTLGTLSQFHVDTTIGRFLDYKVIKYLSACK